MTKFTKLNYFIYHIENGIIDFKIISKCIDKFFNDILNLLEETQYVSFQFSYKLSDGTFRTLGYLNKINKNDKDNLLNNLLFFHQNDIDGYSEVYKETISIYIKYKFLDMSKTENKSLIVDIKNTKKVIKTQLFNKITIPSISKTELWGTVIYKKIQEDKSIRYSILRGGYRFEISQTSLSRDIAIFDSNNKLILDFIDHFKSDNYFIRTIKNKKFHFRQNKLICNIKENKNTNFITKIKQDNIINENIITLDLETYSSIEDNDEVLKVISCCIYDGINKFSFYLSDYNSSDDLLKAAITTLLDEKYNDYKVYIHNLSGFDGIFLLRILATIDNTKLDPIIKDDKMIALTLKFGNKCKISFHDSMLLLPSSLDKLSKSFNVANKKVIFPIYWLMNNPSLNLEYIGSVPNIKYFKDISIEEYNDYVLERVNIWNFKEELLNYNMLDCISLYEVLIKFNSLIFDKFSLNAINYPTLPSLAFGIYRSSFMNDYKIPKIGGKMLHDIKQSYTGGATDMYIPYGENLFHYDINSLYPTSMFKYDMPIGNIKYFKGNILDIMDNPFGFFNCKITSPEHLDNPILQIRHNDRTVSLLGNFEGWFFSEELFNAQKYGYKFEILEGYLFERENIFKDYVSVLHQIKQNTDKSNPMYLIAKLLLNSLYGKFGMTDDLATHKIININNLENFINSKDRITITELSDDLILISYHEINDDKFINDYTDMNISVGVAAAIASYSRIQMTKFKNLSYNKMYYTDTDSAIMEKPLDNSLVGNHLGQMVLEKEYKEFVALAPKVYGGILNNGKEFSKIKGFSKQISYKDFKSLLIKDKSLKLKQNKWFRFIGSGSISIKSQVYTLIPTQNKRELIYDNNYLIGTKAFKIIII